ncbi:DKNYY domain-containing protein [Aeoliella mucimassa]|uniref:DKNYY family protein n=1 Tax=Aeoliella mucimassa TaxID=2527972 RepID=A0A518ARZ5_9BACT|nr:DKNYY domain-containing protein [Aeoliella mucimassa]QDU57492.1 hypothetical protein Pan181_37090 [Aeoliella mucimassa]
MVWYPCLLCAGFAIAGCGKPGFQIENGKPVMVEMNAAVGRESTPIPGADPKTFKPLEYGKNVNAIYAIDANQAYIGYISRAMAIPLSDPATFKIITPNGDYAADENRVYWYGVEVPGADPASFRILKTPCAVDSQRAYIGLKPLEVHSLDHFEVLQIDFWNMPIGNANGRLMAKDLREHWVPAWSRDGVAYYWEATELEGADYESLKILNDVYAKDKATVYFQGKPVRGADAETFVVGVGMNGSDKNHEYNTGRRVPTKSPKR